MMYMHVQQRYEPCNLKLDTF